MTYLGLPNITSTMSASQKIASDTRIKGGLARALARRKMKVLWGSRALASVSSSASANSPGYAKGTVPPHAATRIFSGTPGEGAGISARTALASAEPKDPMADMIKSLIPDVTDYGKRHALKEQKPIMGQEKGEAGSYRTGQMQGFRERAQARLASKREEKKEKKKLTFYKKSENKVKEPKKF